MKPLWLIPLLLTFAAAQPRATVGPRVTLSGEVELGDALDRIGRQLNRRFTGNILRQKKLLQQTYAFDLDAATVAEALDQLALLTGYRIRRQNRFLYRIDVGVPVTGDVGRQFGDFRVWLSMVRYLFYSYRYPAMDRSWDRAQLLPQFELEAPSDPESLRIRSILPPHAVGNDGLELPPLNPGAETESPSGSDPRIWTLMQYVTAPDPRIEMLDRVWFDVRFARELQQYGFDYALDLSVPQLQTDGPFDAQLEPQEKPNWEQGVTITVTGPIPANVPPEQVERWAPRYLWAEGQFLGADDRPLYTETRLEGTHIADPFWVTVWRVNLADVDGDATPERLRLELTMPGAETTLERVEFEHIPLPERRAAAATEK